MGRIAGVSADQTRERLLDAAARVFELKGYEGATVALIAKEAGVTTGAIYAHYSGKAELLADAIRAHGERATAGLFATDGPSGAAGMLTRLGERLVTRDGEDAGLLMEALLAARRDPALADVIAAALVERSEVVERLLGGAQRTAELTDDVTTAAAARFMMMLGLGSMLVSELELPEVELSEWNTFIGRLVGTFTQGDPS